MIQLRVKIVENQEREREREREAIDYAFRPNERGQRDTLVSAVTQNR